MSVAVIEKRLEFINYLVDGMDNNTFEVTEFCLEMKLIFILMATSTNKIGTF